MTYPSSAAPARLTSSVAHGAGSPSATPARASVPIAPPTKTAAARDDVVMADKGFWGKLTSRLEAPRPGTPQWRAFQVVTKLNVWAYRATRGRVGGRFDAAPVCILHHRGARTQQKRETPLVYLPDDDRVILIASMGGMPKNPAWYHNLRANPDVEIERDGRRDPMTAREAEGAEREELWNRVLTVWPTYADYQARTARRIPVLICEPRSP